MGTREASALRQADGTRRGEEIGRSSRFSDQEIAELRHRHVNLNVSLAVLSAQTGLTQDSLSKIMTGKRRKRAKGPTRDSLPPGRSTRNVPPAVKLEIRRDLAAGRKYAWITRKRKVSAGYVSTVAHEMGLGKPRKLFPFGGQGNPRAGMIESNNQVKEGHGKNTAVAGGGYLPERGDHHVRSQGQAGSYRSAEGLPGARNLPGPRQPADVASGSLAGEEVVGT